MKEIHLIGATWCAGCKVLKSKLDAKGVAYKYSDITDEPELVKKFNIRSLPTVIINGDSAMATTDVNSILKEAE